MIDYSKYALKNDLYASFVATENWANLASKIRQKHAKKAIERDGIGDCITKNGEYDFDAGNLLPKSLDVNTVSTHAYSAICELANAYAEFVVNHHRNPRNAGRKPGNFIKTNVKATVPKELTELWQPIENKQAFVREAIAEKLKNQ